MFYIALLFLIVLITTRSFFKATVAALSIPLVLLVIMTLLIIAS